MTDKKEHIRTVLEQDSSNLAAGHVLSNVDAPTLIELLRKEADYLQLQGDIQGHA